MRARTITGSWRVLGLALAMTLVVAAMLGPARAAAPVAVGATTLTATKVQPATAGLERLAGTDAGRPLTVLVPRRPVTAIVLALHGYELDAGWSARNIRLDAQAAAGGWLVAYPSGVGNSWNSGACCGHARSARVDDVGYLTGLATRLRSAFARGRVPVAGLGFSNGAEVLAEISCKRPGFLDAIMEVGGGLDDPTCPAARAARVVQVRSVLDSTVPVGGGVSSFTHTFVQPDTVGVHALEHGVTCHQRIAAGSGLAEQRVLCGDSGRLIERILETKDRHDWSNQSYPGRVNDSTLAAELISSMVGGSLLDQLLPSADDCPEAVGPDVLISALKLSSASARGHGCARRTRSAKLGR